MRFALLILGHSYGMIYRNIGSALKISILPFLSCAIALFISLALITPRLSDINPYSMPTMDVGMIIFLAAFIAVLTVITAWFATSWHRLILLEERPSVLLAFHKDRIASYIWKYIVLVAISFAVSFTLGFIAGTVLEMVAPTVGIEPTHWQILSVELIGGYIPGIITSWFTLRLALVLPATAIGQKMTFGGAWEITKPYSFSILLILIIFGVLVTTVSVIIVGLSLLMTPFIAIAIVFLAWLVAMMNLSILTTLYGHLVERRPLSD